MRRKYDFVAIFIGDFYLSVRAISFYCPEYRGISERVYPFIHSQYGVKVLHGLCIEFTLVHKRSEWSIIPEHKLDGCRQFCLGRFNHIHCQHLVNFIFSNYDAGSQLSMVRKGLDVPLLRSIYLVLGCSNLTELSLRHVLKFQTRTWSFWEDTHCDRLKILFQFANRSILRSESVCPLGSDSQLAFGLNWRYCQRFGSADIWGFGSCWKPCITDFTHSLLGCVVLPRLGTPGS